MSAPESEWGNVNPFAAPKLAPLLSVLLVSLMVASGIGYATQTTGSGSQTQSLTLVVTSMSESSRSSPYIVMSQVTGLYSGSVSFDVGPFAPGGSVVVTYTVENTGNIPASLSTLVFSVTPSTSGFSATNGPIPATLNPGASFSSTITITLQAGLGNSHQGSTAVITLEIGGTGITKTTACTTTFTHTATHTVTTAKTVTVTTKETLTDTTTKTATVTTTVTTSKGKDSPLDATALWTTTSSCTTITVTITTILTTTNTLTTTQTTFTTVTKTVTTTQTVSTTKTVSTTTCTGHDGGK